MATITKGKTFTATEQVTAAKLHQLVDSATISGIINADVGASAAIADTKLAQITTANKVAAGAITDAALNVAALTCDSVASAGAITATTIGGTVGTLTGGLLMTQGTAPTTGATQGGLFTKDVGGEAELFYVRESAGTEIQLTKDGTGIGVTVQVVNVMDGAIATCATAFPIDDTIPQITEGDQVMTLAITPTSATNKLKIDVVVFGSSQITTLGAALFQDATAGALAAGYTMPNTQYNGFVAFTHYMTSGTTSETTFRVRFGASGGGSAYFNGVFGATRLFGGVFASSITITEIAA